MMLFGLIGALYFFSMLFLRFGMGKLGLQEGSKSSGESRFSIVVPFRNEEENLPCLLASLSRIDYSAGSFEVLLVDDASEDASVELCRNFREEHPELDVRLLASQRKTGSPKKDALVKAIEHAKFEYILTTDADCVVPDQWLLKFDEALGQEDVQMLVGPVVMGAPEASAQEACPESSSLAGEKDRRKKGPVRKNFLQGFQELDFLSLQAATIGGFGVDQAFLCNGANLCYKKEAFHQVDGFSGNQEIASGDDLFLLEKFTAAGFKSGYLREQEAVVMTRPQTSWRELLHQRIRWAAKTSAYRNGFGKWMGLVVLLMNLFLVLGIPAMALGIISVRWYFIFFLLKFNVDFLLISRAASFFGAESSLRGYVWSSAFYPFFSTYVGVRALFSGYSWKGRRFKR